MKNFVFNLILFIMLAVVFFIVGETCFRIFKGPPNELAKIVQTDGTTLLNPNTQQTNKSSKEGEFEYTATINNHGYRGTDFTIPKDDKTKRIFAIGDSFTFGVGAEDNETIPYLIEQQLRKNDPNIEVVNAGAGHTGPAKHYFNLNNIHLNYEPDLVVLLFDLTDLWDDWHTERHGIYDKDGDLIGFDLVYLDGKVNWWILAQKHSSFCNWINRKIIRSYKKIADLGFKEYAKAVIEGKKVKAVIANSKKTQDVKIEYDGLLMLRGREEKKLIDKHWGRTAKYLKKIKDVLDERKIPMVIVMYPHGIYVGEDQWKDGRKSWGFEENKIYSDHYAFEIVEEFAQQHRIPFINTLDDFLVADSKQYFFDHDGHLTPEGNIIVADTVASNPIVLDLLNNLN